MDVEHDIGPRRHEDLVAALEFGATEVGRAQVRRLECRAGRPVEDQDAVFEGLEQGALAGGAVRRRCVHFVGSGGWSVCRNGTLLPSMPRPDSHREHRAGDDADGIGDEVRPLPRPVAEQHLAELDRAAVGHRTQRCKKHAADAAGAGRLPAPDPGQPREENRMDDLVPGQFRGRPAGIASEQTRKPPQATLQRVGEGGRRQEQEQRDDRRDNHG